MMTQTKSLCARASAAAIAAALALSPTYAQAPKQQASTQQAPQQAPAQPAKPAPVIDLSQSPAASGKPAARAGASDASAMPFDERTMELGGGAIALLALGAGAFAIARSRRRKREEAAWAEESSDSEARDPLFDEPMFQHEPAAGQQPAAAMAPAPDHQPAMVAPEASAFGWDKAQPCDDPMDDGSDRCPGETWVERAHRGPSPANPSASLKTRLGRAAFFDKREREVAAGRAEPLDTDAGLPDAMVEEQERESA